MTYDPFISFAGDFVGDSSTISPAIHCDE